MKTYVLENRGYFSPEGLLVPPKTPFTLEDGQVPPNGAVPYDSSSAAPPKEEPAVAMSQAAGAKKRMAADR